MSSWLAELRIVNPEMILIAACLAVAVGARLRVGESFVRWISAAGVLLALVGTVGAWNPGFPQYAFGDMLVRDGFSVALMAAVLISCLLVLPHLWVEAHGGTEPLARLHIPVLLCAAGMMLLVSATDLITLFVVAAMLSALMYRLPQAAHGAHHSDGYAGRYLPLSLAASAVVVCGIVLVFSASGSTDLVGIARYLEVADPSAGPMLVAELGLVAAGLVLIVCLTPVHVWSEERLQEIPVPVSAFVAVGSGIALALAVSRTLLSGFHTLAEQWQHLLSFGAILAMVIGHGGALFQSRLMRLFRYSGVGHAGYITLALVSGSRFGVSSMILYVAAYSIMSLGAIGIAAHISGRSRAVTLCDCAGLASISQVPAVLLAILMLGLGGVPLTIGFIALFQSLLAAAFAGHMGVAVGLLMSIVSALYHLRVVGLICCRGSSDNRVHPQIPVSVIAVTALVALAAIVLGVYPTPIIRVLRTIVLPGS